MIPISKINFLERVKSRLQADLGYDGRLTESLLRSDNTVDAIRTVLLDLENVAAFACLEVWAKQKDSRFFRLVVSSDPLTSPEDRSFDETASEYLLHLNEATFITSLNDHPIGRTLLPKHRSVVYAMLAIPFSSEARVAGTVLCYFEQEPSLQPHQIHKFERAVELIVSLLETADLFMDHHPWYSTLDGTKLYLRPFLALEYARDRETQIHERLVASLTYQIGLEMHISESNLSILHTAARLHDIGKMMIPMSMLNKPGKLNADEMDLTREHVLQGVDILKLFGFHPSIQTIVLEHHERYNGSGYPKGLKANEIDTMSAILAVADVLAAMSEDRPYHKESGLKVAIHELRSKKGVKYHPVVVDVVSHMLENKQLILEVDKQ